MKKITIALTVLLLVLNIVFGSVAFADVTSWADVDEEAQDVYALYMQYAYWLLSGYDISVEEALQHWDATIVNSLEWCEAFGWYVCPYDNIYYYIHNGELWCYEGNISNASAGVGGRCRDSGRGGGGRGKVRVSGNTFNDMIEKVNGYYMPSANTDTMIASIKNPVHQSYDVNGYGWAYRSSFKNNYRALIPLRLGSDLLFGDDVSEYWLYPFFYDDDNGQPYYGQYQVRLYHKVVTSSDNTSTVCLYADYYDMIDGNNVLDVLVTDDVASYPYIILMMYHGSSNIAGVNGFANLNNFLQLKTFPSIGTLSASDINTGTLYSFDLTATSTGYAEILEDTFLPLDDDDDVGFYVSSEQFDSVFKKDWEDLPSDYIVTYQGDNFYDYSITNSYGDTTTIYNYITNNYYFPEDDGEDDGGESGGLDWDISFDDFIINIGDTISNSLDDFSIVLGDMLKGNFENVIVNIGDIINESITNIGDTISTSIENTFTYLFIPTENYYNDLEIRIETAVKEKFEYAYELPEIFDNLFVELKSPANDSSFKYINVGMGGEELLEYPCWKFTINYFGQEMELVILDFAMFKEVLPTVRITVLSFAWLVYLWWLFRYLPTLIGGVGDVVASTSTIIDNKNNNKEG